jgi:ribosomal protein S19
MSPRSAWRLPYIHPAFLTANFLTKKIIPHASRSWTVPLLPTVGRTFEVHDGRKMQKVIYKTEMVGYKLGSFVLTKKIGQKLRESKKKRRR